MKYKNHVTDSSYEITVKYIFRAKGEEFERGLTFPIKKSNYDGVLDECFVGVNRNAKQMLNKYYDKN